jgi:pyrroline-5-carboxylate reductase
MTKKNSIVVIGGGNMGGAIIGGLHQDCVVTVCEQDRKKANSLRRKYGVQEAPLAAAVAGRDAVILAVKPQDFAGLLEQIRPLVDSRQVVVSVAAGITTRSIERRLGPGPRVVRVMPNLPAVTGQGISAVAAGESAKPADLVMVCRLFRSVGLAVVVEEKMIDAVTAVSGSGPAYVFYFAEILQAAARKLGLKEAEARLFVLQTLKGSVSLLEGRGADAGEMRRRVTSKGGTTAAALDVLAGHKIDKIFEKALIAARARARELSKKAG